mmetsp:Transcript_26278/g.87097  ORF Transcript_26278/g.87097 Transcript_26278/m.87097 type:complete len:254 (+) Transcript_26278:183-944(+)
MAWFAASALSSARAPLAAAATALAVARFPSRSEHRQDHYPQPFAWKAPIRCDGHAGPRLTCLGEAMLRYIPDPDTSSAPPSRFTSRWLQSAGGAELNLTVALANLGWGGRARWISVVPHGHIGESLMKLASAAYSDGGAENLILVRRAEGDLGIYHVWPLEGKVAFQRRNSTFGQMDPDWFDDAFWLRVLSEGPDSSAPLHVLHLTGITPLIGPRPHKAGCHAHSLKRRIQGGVSVSHKHRRIKADSHLAGRE